MAFNFPGSPTNGQLYTQGGVTYRYNGVSWAVVPALQREKLIGDRQYYVRVDGNNANNGLANSAGGAFRTIQKAVDVVCDTLDVVGFNVSINVGDGVYTENVFLKAFFASGDDANFGTVSLVGITDTPSACVIDASGLGGAALKATGRTNGWYVGGFKFVNNGGPGVYVADGAYLCIGYVGGAEFGWCQNGHLFAERDSMIFIATDYTISGNAAQHFGAAVNCAIEHYQGHTVTLTGTPVFSVAFAYCDNSSLIKVLNTTYSGAATGKRFQVAHNSTINTGTNGLNYFPGSAVGTLASGGMYNDLTGGQRERLTAERIYYVRPDGNNTNNGLTNSAAGAWQTIQHAIDWIGKNIDVAESITIQLGNGTYNESLYIGGVGGGIHGSNWFAIRGDPAAPSNVVLNSPVHCFNIDFGDSSVCIIGLKLVAAVHGIVAAGTCYVDSCEFGAVGGAHLHATMGGSISIYGPHIVSGGAASHYRATLGGSIGIGAPVTLVGTPAFTTAFAHVDMNGSIECAAVYSGAATGRRFLAEINGTLKDNMGGKLDHFPGSIDGVLLTGGQYYGMIGSRERLTADRNYYVRTDGNDANTGLADSAAGAFLTIQKAIDVAIDTLDFAGLKVTINVGAGTFAAVDYQIWGSGVGIEEPLKFVIQGAGVAATILANSSFTFNYGAKGRINDLKITSPGTSVFAWQNSMVELGAIDYGAAGGSHVAAMSGSIIDFQTAYTISGSAWAHVYCDGNSEVRAHSRAITLTGTPDFREAFVVADFGAVVHFNGCTFSGAATGKRFFVDHQSLIYTATDGKLDFLPGSVAGETKRGGRYDQLGEREKLTAHRTYYVRADGNDSNNGLTDSAAGAFLTIEKATALITGTLDPAGWNAIVSVGPGTFAAPSITGEGVGIPYDQGLSIQGAGPTTILNGTVQGYGPVLFELRNLKLQNAAGNCIMLWGGAQLYYNNLEFGECSAYHIFSSQHSAAYASGTTITISGSAHAHAYTERGGSVECNNTAFTLTGTPHFFNAFASAIVHSYSWWFNNTFTGAATGRRFNVEDNSVIKTGTNGKLDFFPGSVAGTTASGGRYDHLGEREKIDGDREYYVRTDGNDNNNGLTNDAAGAFLTIQRAIDVLTHTLDFNGHYVEINVGAGTFTSPPIAIKASGVGWLSPEALTIKGQGPASTIVVSTGHQVFSAYGHGAGAHLEAMKITGPTQGLEVWAGSLSFRNIEFGAMAGAQVHALANGTIYVYGNYSISGGAAWHFCAENGGHIELSGGSVGTIIGTPAFTNAFATAFAGGTIQMQPNNTFPGTVTGKRYDVNLNGVIHGTAANANFFPGDVAGTTATGGQYV